MEHHHSLTILISIKRNMLSLNCGINNKHKIKNLKLRFRVSNKVLRRFYRNNSLLVTHRCKTKQLGHHYSCLLIKHSSVVNKHNFNHKIQIISKVNRINNNSKTDFLKCNNSLHSGTNNSVDNSICNNSKCKNSFRVIRNIRREGFMVIHSSRRELSMVINSNNHQCSPNRINHNTIINLYWLINNSKNSKIKKSKLKFLASNNLLKNQILKIISKV